MSSWSRSNRRTQTADAGPMSWGSARGEVREPPGVALVHHGLLAARGQPLEGELTDRLEHLEPGLVVPHGGTQQAVVRELGEQERHLATHLGCRAADRLDVIQARLARE